jgi:hypothetical protein
MWRIDFNHRTKKQNLSREYVCVCVCVREPMCVGRGVLSEGLILFMFVLLRKINPRVMLLLSMLMWLAFWKVKSLLLLCKIFITIWIVLVYMYCMAVTYSTSYSHLLAATWNVMNMHVKKQKLPCYSPCMYSGGELYLLLILDLSTRWGDWFVWRPGHALPTLPIARGCIWDRGRGNKQFDATSIFSAR